MENENKAVEYVLDSFAFLAHLENEERGVKVTNILKDAITVGWNKRDVWMGIYYYQDVEDSRCISLGANDGTYCRKRYLPELRTKD